MTLSIFDQDASSDPVRGNAYTGHPLLAKTRIKSEAPLEYQLRNATPSDPDNQRRLRALQGLPSQGDDTPARLLRSQDNVPGSPECVQRPTREDTRAKPKNVQSVGDLFANFQPPEGPKVFKSEPIDEETWQAMQAQAAASSKRKKKKRTNKAQELRRGTGGRSYGDDSEDDVPRTSQGSSRSAFPIVVDLTEAFRDDHRQAQEASHAMSTSMRPPPGHPQQLTATQVQLMDQVNVPEEVLQQARDIYRHEGLTISDTVRKWLQLKSFVEQHPASFITPGLCAVAQAHTFHSANVPIGSESTHPNDGGHSQSDFNSPPSVSTNSTTGALVRGPVNTNTLVGTRQIEFEAEAERRQQAQLEAFHTAVSPTSTARLVPPHLDRRQENASVHHRLYQAQTLNRPKPTHIAPPRGPIGPTVAQIVELMQPANLMPDLLPPNAPNSHPHLVKIWEPALLRLPTKQHEHLRLPDTVVSILARHDLKARSTVHAFLDVQGVSHFWFLFKAKEGSLHCWSIEREEDLVTIGVERSQRPPNDVENARPSSGQYDLTVHYKIVGPTTAESNPDDNQSQSRPPSLPGVWTLHGTTIFPLQPSLYDFFYHTPPTRGADEHFIITHPQCPDHPSSSALSVNLSVLARYLQYTAFTTNAIDADFQTAWGRKVRYDAVLGRVRVIYDYALKAAKTQKEKRERGEYNRPKPKQELHSKSRGGHGKERIPGAGEAKDFLLNSQGFSSARGGTSMSGTTLQTEMDDFVVGDEVAEAELEAHRRAAELDRNEAKVVSAATDAAFDDGREYVDMIQEPLRKKIKREGREGSSSGSEYSDGSD